MIVVLVAEKWAWSGQEVGGVQPDHHHLLDRKENIDTIYKISGLQQTAKLTSGRRWSCDLCDGERL